MSESKIWLLVSFRLGKLINLLLMVAVATQLLLTSAATFSCERGSQIDLSPKSLSHTKL